MQRNKIFGEFKHAFLDNLPYKTNSCDLVIGKYALQNAKNVSKSLEEAIRVAKSNSKIIILTKHPFRNLLEGIKYNDQKDYFNQEIVTSNIFDKQIALKEYGHTVMEYLIPEILKSARLEKFEEGCDFFASEQIIPGVITLTYMIMGFRKD